MKTLIPWALLGGLILRQATRRECDCVVLRRRLVLAHRDARGWREEAVFWAKKLDEAMIREQEVPDRLETA
jgi:hypothetical protein